MMDGHNCAENLGLNLNIQRFGNTNIKYLEVRGVCNKCGRKAVFRGPPGLNPSAPTVAIDGSEAIFPFLFEGEKYDGRAAGYSVTSPEAN
jgi:hypothetical protein